jgi:subtilisin-like proprotein convertase family protein
VIKKNAMKRFYGFIFFVLTAVVSSAQTFTVNTNAAIQDGQRTTVPIPVSGLPATADSVYGFCSVVVDIAHSYVGDLDLILISPANDSITLTNNIGGGGNNFTGTVFVMSAIIPVQSGSAPFTGNYIPELSLNNFNDGQNPNGTWLFCVTDDAPNDTGHIVTITLNFCANPPADPPNFISPCAVNNGISCLCPDGSSDCDLLPDMTASADIIVAQHTEYPGLMTLSNATPNIGWGPMEIHGSNSCWCDTVSVPCSTITCPNGNPPTQKLLQRIYHKNGGNITWIDTLTPGEMSYHPSHGHVHVNNWAEFTLRKQNVNDPNATHWPIYAAGSKVSFCLINLGDCTNDLGYCRDSLNNILTMDSIPNAPFGLVSGCGVDQGIYTGMLDIYNQTLPGMFIPLTDICNGNYFVVSVTDPDNNFIEQNENNNWAAAPVTITLQSDPITSGFNITSISGLSLVVSNNNTDVTSFVWDFGDGNTDTINNPATHTYTAFGTYTVTLTQTNPCGTYDTSFVVLVNGLQEEGDFAAHLLKASPNPSNGSTDITWQMPEQGEAQLELYDLLGNRIAIISKGVTSVGIHSEKLDFNAYGLSAGAYILRLKTPNHYSTLQLINTN